MSELLDPQLVARSRYTGRHTAAFGTPRFRALKASIAHDGGNAVPVLVRPTDSFSPGRYELAYGVMRTQACLELGLPVRALVEPIDDRDLVLKMHRENEGSDRLSAFEQGVMFEAILNAGLFPSSRRLADALSLTFTQLNTATKRATLPTPVVEAFASVLTIKGSWAGNLARAVEVDPLRVPERAQAIAASSPPLSAVKVYAALLGASLG